MKKVNGFTLLELLITLSVIIVVSTITFPSFANIIADNKQVTHYNQLVGSISLARSEAIKRGTRTAICQSSNGSSCTKQSKHWHLGWLVFNDTDSDNQVDNDETIISIQQAFNQGVSISYGSRTRIAYYPDGLAVGSSNGTFLICDDRGDEAKSGLIVSVSGRPRKADSSDLSDKLCASH
jgi:type IV fimbrial biogenesis protein FimT